MKKPFFFKVFFKPVHALYVIETNRQSKSTGLSKFVLKSISSAFSNLCHSLVKRLRVKFPEKPTDLTPRMPSSGDFFGHFFDEVTENGNNIREPGLYEVNEYFEKAG